ncbi:MAG: hypothetical protein AAGL24_22280 [Pseudomonadota bacterium]
MAGNGANGNGKSGLDEVSNAIIGTWLFFLYLLTIVISILMLSSYQIQARMQVVDVSGVSLSIWRLIELSESYALQEQEKETREQALEQAKAKLTGIEARIRELDAQYTPVFDEFYRDIRQFKGAYERANPGFRFVPLDRHRSSVKVLYEDVSGQIGEENLDETLSQTFADLTTRFAAGDDIFRNISSAKKNAAAVTEEIEQDRDSLAEAAERVRLGVFGIIGADPRYAGLNENEKAQLQDAVSEFSSLKNIFWRVPYSLAIMPTEILVLFLVLAMGVLGSTIFITQLFFRRDKYQSKIDDELNLAFFFSRPWFGAITALSIFVLAKAGVLFLTDPTSQSGQATLSPFFISFIAIISGLFSEQAIQAIKKAAEDWFRNQNTFADRWGIGLNQALEKSGRDKASFATATGIPIETVEAWFAEEKPVAPDKQDILSAWLEAPVRTLFTDIPPNANRGDAPAAEDDPAAEADPTGKA